MKKIYCINCGNPVSFDITVPKFCSGCGESLTSVGSGIKGKTLGKVNIGENEDGEDVKDSFLDDIINRISENDFQPDGSLTNINVYSFETIAKQQKGPEDSGRGQGRVKSGQDLISDINKHCGSLKRRVIDDSGSE